MLRFLKLNSYNTALTLCALIFFTGCSKENLKVSIAKKSSIVSVSSIRIVDHQFVITGKNLKNVNNFAIKDGATNIPLQINSKSDTSIVASALSGATLVAGKALDFVLSTASASSSFSLTISPCETCDNAPDKSVLTYDLASGKWGPASLSGINYKGAYAASLSVDPSDSSPSNGDYYIINDPGTINGVAYVLGDWIVYNADSSAWELLPNAISLPVINRTTVQPVGSLKIYGANTANYIELSVPALAGNTTYKFPATDGVAGQVLTTNSAGQLSWSTVLGGTSGGSGSIASVTSANSDIAVASTTSAPVLTLNSGTTANQILKLNASAQIPAVDGSLLTGLNPANLASAIDVSKGGTGLTTGTSGGIPYFDSTSTMNTSALLGLNGIMIGGGAGGAPTSLGTGTAGQILTSAGASAPAWITTLPIANGGTGATTPEDARTALGITDAATLTTGALPTNIPVLGGSGIVADSLCAADSSGGTFSCTTANTSAGLAGLITGETGTGALVFATDPAIGNISPTTNFTLTQNAVIPFTSEGANAVVNTLYLKAGSVGIGTNNPNASAVLDITSTNKGLLIPRMTTVERDAITTPATGLQVYNTTTNKLNFYSGGWQEVGSAAGTGASGITSLGGLTGAIQTFATGTAGTAPAFNSASTTHTLNIPMASAASVTAGLISKSDYDAFIAKQGTLTNSAGLASALSDETGTGLSVFSASPTFTGVPLAPTAAVNTNSTQLATTAFVLGQAGSASPLMNNAVAVGTSLLYAREDHVHPVDTSRSPASGSSSITTVGTVTTGTWNGSIIGMPYGGTGANITPVNGGVVYSNATTMAVTGVGVSGQYLKSAAAAPPAWSSILIGDLKSSVSGNLFPATGCSNTETLTYSVGIDSFICVAISAGTTLTNSASLATALSDETGTGLSVFSAAPTFTGIPLAPTAAVDTNTTQLATTAFVLAQAGSASPLMNNAVAVGTSTRFARQDHVHPVDTSRAPASGSSSVTTVGTVTSGTWNAGVIGMIYGGTGANITPANGGVVYSNATTMAVTAAGTSGQFLKSNGAAAPTWGNLTFTCPAGQVVQSINNGTPTCVAAVAVAQSCPAKQVMTGIDASGAIICTAASSLVSVITTTVTLVSDAAKDINISCATATASCTAQGFTKLVGSSIRCSLAPDPSIILPSGMKPLGIDRACFSCTTQTAGQTAYITYSISCM